MPSAVMLGHGPVSWLESPRVEPPAPPEAFVVAGHRDIEEARELGSLLPQDVPGLVAPDADAVRADPGRDRLGRRETRVRAAVARCGSTSTSTSWTRRRSPRRTT